MGASIICVWGFWHFSVWMKFLKFLYRWLLAYFYLWPTLQLLRTMLVFSCLPCFFVKKSEGNIQGQWFGSSVWFYCMCFYFLVLWISFFLLGKKISFSFFLVWEKTEFPVRCSSKSADIDCEASFFWTIG